MSTVRIAIIISSSKPRHLKLPLKSKVKMYGWIHGKLHTRGERYPANQSRMIKDDRVRDVDYNALFDVGRSADRLG